VTGSLASRLHAALAGTQLAERVTQAAAPLIERRSQDASVRRLEGPVLAVLVSFVKRSLYPYVL
jgi:hypothetical protein